ncbi:NaeI family type II restriction endonuclease [Isoptericola sp. b490]|uniref:NaeI family type II restriction endonuclease n=1 Tax=Actinotalea lenta TaxID=3064654 RepID=UPI00271434C9|nr:NaeI family type II restriction endonuclease [Isoptericola sp. b490]MDO8119714.1 NaeI family type II restriction endonuclease [Isoptericola sp. b490]
MPDEDDYLFELPPTGARGPAGRPSTEAAARTPGAPDSALEEVFAWLLDQDPGGARFSAVLRDSLDQVLDGPRTMRFRYAELRKTEKTHMGTVVEINLGKEFDLADGIEMDYRIAGHDVDCKYSMSIGGWELPLESLGHLVLLTWADDDVSRWSAGLWRVDPRHLGRGAGNRDRKKKMLRSGQEQIRWLWRDAQLPENLLLHLPQATASAILRAPSGQQRVDELFRRVQRRIIRRDVVLTVAQQKDGPRRARTAREQAHLGREGILVLGHYEWDVATAEALGLPVPRSGEWVSARVAPADPGAPSSFEADGIGWRLAEPEEPVHPAPKVPRSRPLADPD